MSDGDIEVEVSFPKGRPDVRGWSWKQVIFGGLFAVSMGLDNVAAAIRETAPMGDDLRETRS